VANQLNDVAVSAAHEQRQRQASHGSSAYSSSSE
jgi:hypothetical protein